MLILHPLAKPTHKKASNKPDAENDAMVARTLLADKPLTASGRGARKYLPVAV